MMIHGERPRPSEELIGPWDDDQDDSGGDDWGGGDGFNGPLDGGGRLAPHRELVLAG